MFGFFEDSTTLIDGCTFEDNVANNAVVFGVRNGGILLEIRDSTFTNNRATIGDGGIARIYEWNEFTDALSEVRLDNNVFSDNHAEEDGGVFHVDTSSGFISGMDSCEFKGNTAAVGGVAFFSGLEGLENSKYRCKQCKKNKARLYGDDIASEPFQIEISDFTKTFNNLESFDTEAVVIDFHGNRVKGQRFSITPKLSGKSKKDAVLVDAATATTDESTGIATFVFSIVSDFGEKVKLTFSSAGGLDLDPVEVESEAQKTCRGGEVIIDFPPDTSEFPVCVEASTQEPITTLKVFWIITGVLLIFLILFCLFLCGYVVYFNYSVGSDIADARADGHQVNPFQFSVFGSWSISLGIFFGCAACFIQIPDLSDATCALLPWFWALCGVFVIAPLCSDVIFLTLGPQQTSGRVPISVTLLAIGVSFVLQCIVLVVWTSIDRLEFDYAQDDNELTPQCESDHTMVYVGILIGLNAVPLLLCMCLTFASEFGKFRSQRWAHHIQNVGLAVTHITFVATATVVLLFLEYSDQTARYIIQTCGFLLGAYVLVFLLFVLPIYAVYTGEFDAVTSCYTHGTGGTYASSSSHRSDKANKDSGDSDGSNTFSSSTGTASSKKSRSRATSFS